MQKDRPDLFEAFYILNFSVLHFTFISGKDSWADKTKKMTFVSMAKGICQP